MKYLKYKDKKKKTVYIISSKADKKEYTDKIKEKHEKRDKNKTNR